MSNRHWLVDGDLRQLGRKLGKETLVGSKAGPKLGEGVHLAGETESVARHIHKLARGTGLLTHSEDTLLLHGLSKATEEVLAETHTPAHAHLSEDLHVLVNETVHLGELLDDRDDAATEDWVQLRRTSTDTLRSLCADGRREGHRLEAVTNKDGTLTVTTLDVGNDGVLGGASIALNREVVVGNGGTVGRDTLVHLVGHTLHTLGDFELESLPHGRHVRVGTGQDNLGLGLTELDGTSDSLVQVSAHSLGLSADVAALCRRLDLPGVSDTSDVLETLLVLLVVGSDSVHQSVEPGLELSLGAGESSSSAGLGHFQSVRELTVGVELLSLLGSHASVHRLSGTSEVLGGLTTELGHESTELSELSSRRLLQVLDLLRSHDFVLIEKLLDLTAGTLRVGEALVGETHDTVQLSVGTLVHTDLGSLVGDDHGGHNSDLTCKAGLLALHGSDQGIDVHGELLAGTLGLLPGKLLTPGNVLHSLAEASILKSRALGEGIVEATDSTCESTVLSSTVRTHLGVGSAELLVVLLTSTGQGSLDELEGGVVTGSRGLVGSLEMLHVGSAGRRNLLTDGVNIGLHLGSNLLGVSDHSGTVGINTSVGLLNTLGSLFLEGKEGTSLGTDSIAEGAGSLLLLVLDLVKELTTGSCILGVGSRETLVETEELLVGPGDNLLQVTLGEGSSRAHSIEDLATHLSTSTLGGELEVLNVGVDALGEGRDLSANAGRELIAGLLVHLLRHLLDLLGTCLTLLHSTTNGSLELELVSLGPHAEHAAATGRLDSLAFLDLGELLDGLHGLLVVLHHSGVEGTEAVGEAVLGSAESLVSVKAGTTRSLSELLVGSLLGLLVLSEDSEELAGGLGKTTLLVLTVLSSTLADLSDLKVELLGHHLHAVLDLGLVLGNDASKSLVLLGEDLLTVVTELDHALHLSIHVAVHTGLLEAVLGDDTLELSHTRIELGNLVLHSGTKVQKVHLELLLSRGDASIGLGLGCVDVGHSLSKALVLEGSVRVESGSHTSRCLGEHHVRMVAVLGHGGTNITELGSRPGRDRPNLASNHGADTLVHGSRLSSKLVTASLGFSRHLVHVLVEPVHRMLEVLASLARVDLDLRSVSSDVCVGLPNFGIGRGVQGR